MKKTATKTIVDPMETVLAALENCANIIAQVQQQNMALDARIHTLECELALIAMPTAETPAPKASRVKIPALFATAPKVSSPVKPKAKTPRAARDTNTGTGDLLTRCVDAAKANIRKGVYGEKVTIMYPGDIRCFLTVGLRKEIKAHRLATGQKLEAFAHELSDAYHAATGIDPVTLF